MGATIGCIICSFLILLLVYNQKRPYKTLVERNVKDLATQELYTVEADRRAGISLVQWIYSVLVICYRRNDSMQVMPVIRTWACEHLNPKVEEDAEEAYTRFLSVLMEAKDLGINPKFNVSCEYDYHELPISLKYCTYVNCSSLIWDIDEMLGESVNEQ